MNNSEEEQSEVHIDSAIDYLRVAVSNIFSFGISMSFIIIFFNILLIIKSKIECYTKETECVDDVEINLIEDIFNSFLQTYLTLKELSFLKKITIFKNYESDEILQFFVFITSAILFAIIFIVLLHIVYYAILEIVLFTYSFVKKEGNDKDTSECIAEDALHVLCFVIALFYTVMIIKITDTSNDFEIKKVEIEVENSSYDNSDQIEEFEQEVFILQDLKENCWYKIKRVEGRIELEDKKEICEI